MYTSIANRDSSHIGTGEMKYLPTSSYRTVRPQKNTFLFFIFFEWEVQHKNSGFIVQEKRHLELSKGV